MKTKEPAITVCMPVYNAARYLRECIDSILAQTFTDFDLLIVDDGSTDNSRDIVRSYRDKRIRLMENRHDYIGSLNKLLDEARGKYIARMDADDVMMPDRLAVQFEYMEEHPHIDILGGGMEYVGNESEKFIPYHNGIMSVSLFMNGCPLAHPTIMMRRLSISSLRYNKDYIYAEDYHLWVQAIKAGLNITNIKNIVIKYRISENQVSNRHHKEQKRASQLIQDDLADWVTKDEIKWAIPNNKNLPASKKELTIIITFLNEGKEVENTIRGIRKTVGSSVDIIAINDCSYDGYCYGEILSPYDVLYIVNRRRKGVAASRDLGVSLCRTPYFLLLDAHMRFYDNLWPEKIIDELNKDDRQLLCCQTKFLQKNEKTGEVYVSKNCPQTYGAYSPFQKKTIWPDIIWNLKEFETNKNKETIPTVLGACYAASKRYWQYLRGLEGLINYGSDESFISFKVWLEGGKCILLKDVVIGHIYRGRAPYTILNKDYIYNLLFIAKLLFPQSLYCKTAADALQKNKKLTLEVIDDIDRQKKNINELKTYFKTIFTRDIEQVLALHKKYRQSEEGDIRNNFSNLHEIYSHIQKEQTHDDGIFKGKIGLILWLCHYSRYTQNTHAEDLASSLYLQVEENVLSQRHSWNFSYGLCGIGWGILYLWFNNMLEEFPTDSIDSIDRQLEVIDPYLIKDISFETGIGGVLAYLCLRLKVGKMDWSDTLIKKWYKRSKDILRTPATEVPTYYALWFSTIIEEGTDKSKPIPLIGIWLDFPTHLPENSKYWDYSLINGILGHTIQIMKEKHHNYENK